MPYTKHSWSNNEAVTSAKLNAIEDGIKEINMAYEKNTWARGDVVTSAKLNHMEDGIAGGGDSDFSTAEVTLANDCSGQPLIFPVVTNNGLDHIEISEVSEAGMYVIPLYNGHYLIKDGQTLAQIIEVSGNIEEIGSGRDAYFDITGDCVITPWNE